MNAFPGMGNIDPSKMDAAQMKQMLNLFSGMSDDQIKNTMKMMGIDMDPSVIRQFVDQLKNADDDTINKFKEQYTKGKVNMNSFSKYSKSEAKVKEAKKLIDDNKFNEAIELCEKEINELAALAPNEEKEKVAGSVGSPPLFVLIVRLDQLSREVRPLRCTSCHLG